MNSNLEWIKEIVKSSTSGNNIITCPMLVDRVCTIYEDRPSCCRNYPQREGYCGLTKKCKIAVIGLIGNEVESNSLCSSCKTLCCEGIMVPNNVEFTKEEVRAWLDISCADCRNLFSSKEDS